MKHDIHAATRLDDGWPIAQVGMKCLHAEDGERLLVAAAKCPNAIASGYQLFDNIQP
jgi:hypothetical protein